MSQLFCNFNYADPMGFGGKNPVRGILGLARGILGLAWLGLVGKKNFRLYKDALYSIALFYFLKTD